MDVEGERAVVSIVGRRPVASWWASDGEVLDALQELTRLAVYRETGERSRLMLDISGHRAEVAASSRSWPADHGGPGQGAGERVALRADDARSSARSCTTPSRPPG